MGNGNGSVEAEPSVFTCLPGLWPGAVCGGEGSEGPATPARKQFLPIGELPVGELPVGELRLNSALTGIQGHSGSARIAAALGHSPPADLCLLILGGVL